jgi:ubiquinone/menaquinone biosynthesis C-methylase UbiE
MNEEHAKFCSSAEWIECLRTEVVAPLLAGIAGDDVLELGPGPGAATGWLAEHVRHLTCLESDPKAALNLTDRFVGRNVDIVEGDASAMEFADESFDTVCCFTMLHHVPTTRQQNELLSEALRVLRTGGAFVGSDSLASVDLHHFHVGDTYNPVEPSSFLTRLQAAGFVRISLMVDWDMRFIAYKPKPDDDDASEARRS